MVIGCKEEEDSDNPPIINNPVAEDTLVVDQELRSYFHFNIGSTWIYRRKDTNAILYDTAFCDFKQSEFIFNGDFPFAWEKATSVIRHTYYPSSPNSISPYLGVTFSTLGAKVDRVNATSSGVLLSGLYTFLSIPIDSASMAFKSFEDNGASLTTLLDTGSYIFNNVQYNDVIHLKYGNQNFEYELWIAKNIGLIKLANDGDQSVWEIESYSIN